MIREPSLKREASIKAIVTSAIKMERLSSNFGKTDAVRNRSLSHMLKEKFSSSFSLFQSRCTFSYGNVPLEDRFITYLKHTLSSFICSSVYLKDFIKIFSAYTSRTSSRYNFRSKSAGRCDQTLSSSKQISTECCLFTDYLFNIYLDYNFKKEAVTKSHFIMDKNII